MADDAPKPGKKPRGKCIGFSEMYEIKQRERERRNGQPWIARKFIVGVVGGIIGYTYYVYVVRLCISMIRQRGAMGSRAQGSELFYEWQYKKSSY